MRSIGAAREWWRRLGEGHKAAASCVVLLAVYATLVYGVLPRHVFFSGDEGEKLVLAASVARSGDVWNVAYEYPGQRFDPEIRFFPFQWVQAADGKPVPFHVSTMVFLTAPLYDALGVDGLYLLPLVSGVAVAYLARRLAWLMGSPYPWAVTLIVGLCTPVFFYSLTSWDHTPTLVYSTLVVYLLALQSRRRRWWEIVLAGVVAGLGLWTRREMYFFVAACTAAYVYVFRWRRQAWAEAASFGCGVLSMFALMKLQEQVVYGGASVIELWFRVLPKGEGTSGSLSVAGTVRGWALRQAGVVLAQTVDGSSAWLERVFLALSFVGTIAVHRMSKLRTRPPLVVVSAVLQAIGTALAVAHRRLPSIAGLVPTLPLASMGLVYEPLLPRDRLSAGRLVKELVAAISVAFLCLGLLGLPSFGGLGWGPRYLAPVFPLLAVLAWDTLWRSLSAQRALWGRRAVWAAFSVLVATGVAVQCVGVYLLGAKKGRMLDVYAHTRALDTQYVLSDQQWYLEEMGSLYFEKVLLHVRDQEEYEELVERLYRGGVQRYAWVPSEVSSIEPQVRTDEFAVRSVAGVLLEFEVQPHRAASGLSTAGDYRQSAFAWQGSSDGTQASDGTSLADGRVMPHKP